MTDTDAPGPDRGAGGDYLLIPPGYDGEIPDGYHVAHSSTHTNLLALRGFLVDGRTDAATAMFEGSVRIYPLSAARERPAMEFISMSGRSFNTIHANDQVFYNEVAEVIKREPVEMIDPETRGLLAAIGIHKDAEFDPDERMRATLADAAAVGNATARAICFQTRDSTSSDSDRDRGADSLSRSSLRQECRALRHRASLVVDGRRTRSVSLGARATATSTRTGESRCVAEVEVGQPDLGQLSGRAVRPEHSPAREPMPGQEPLLAACTSLLGGECAHCDLPHPTVGIPDPGPGDRSAHPGVAP